mmetsp:Transcript_20964/g.9629  ORF Transcript_20964/g.9629 Transcript_20964/m.9629 type:complete len:92 (-) Transcript_20964:102-377(-)
MIGPSFFSQRMSLKDGRSLKLQIWDTAGQEKYRSLDTLYYQDASAAIITYDITDVSTFLSCEYWLGELKKQWEDEACVLVLCGNKNDRYEE